MYSPANLSRGLWDRALRAEITQALRPAYSSIMIFGSSAIFRRCRFLTPTKHWSAEHLFAGFAVLILVCAILLSTKNAVSIGYLYERSYNEGWNMYNAE